MNEIGITEFFFGFGGDARAAVVAVFIGEFAHILLNEREDFLWVSKQIFEVGNLLCDLFVFLFDLPAFERGKAAQLHVEDRLRLQIAQLESLHQVRFGNIGILRFTNGLDDRVEICQRDQVTVKDVLPRPRLCQLEVRTADDDRLTMLDEYLQRALQRKRPRLAVHKGEHLRAEGSLQGRIFVKLVQHLLWLRAALEFDDDAHTALIGFIAQVGDLVNFVFAHEFRNTFDQGRLVD